MLSLPVVTLFRLRSVSEHKPADQMSCRLRCMPENRPVPFTFLRKSSSSQANVSERICNLLRASIINYTATEPSGPN
jgi:hypothetical protein